MPDRKRRPVPPDVPASVQPRIEPPRAERRPHRVVWADGSTVDDPWYWLRDRDDPATIAYLEAENAHTDTAFAPLADLRELLFDEIRSRVQETDASAPVLRPAGPGRPAGWVYYRRTLEGQQYAIHCRRPVPSDVRDVLDLPPGLRTPVDPASPPDDEVVLLDENLEAAQHDFFQLGGLSVSPDGRLAAEAVDLTGDEVFEVRIRDLTTGELLADRIARAAYGLAWSNDSATFLYTVPDEAWRPCRVLRHRLGAPSGDDELVFEEPDERYWLSIGRTRSEAFLAIRSGSKTSTEWHLIDADDPEARPRLVAPRATGVEYDLDHRGDTLYLVTNADGAEDFKLCVAPVSDPDRPSWVDLVPHRPGTRLESADVFAQALVLSERTDARTQLRLCDPETGVGSVLPMPHDTYSAALAQNPAFDGRVVRFTYTSMISPTEVVDLEVATGERTVVKRQPVRDYDQDDYVTWREWATSTDGTRVPISLVRRASVPLDGTAPGLLYGYGSYELSLDPAFSAARLSLLDRGIVFGFAHVRGGGELGRRWYEDGKFLAKANTFTDFAACADHLVGAGIVARERLAIRGGSAGGLLIGAVLNLRPELCAAAVAEVPFVDIVTTMSDPTIPLTVVEYEEWGDPSDPDVLAAMRAYSPYDNVRPTAYPPLLVTAGLHDPRVQYWEPAKWVAKLRATATGGPILLWTELDAGHAGRSGRYDAWRDEARVLAFVLDRVGANPVRR